MADGNWWEAFLVADEPKADGDRWWEAEQQDMGEALGQQEESGHAATEEAASAAPAAQPEATQTPAPVRGDAAADEGAAKQVTKRLTDLRKMRRQVQETGGDDRIAQVKEINAEIEREMWQLNQAVEEALAARRGN